MAAMKTAMLLVCLLVACFLEFSHSIDEGKEFKLRDCFQLKGEQATEDSVYVVSVLPSCRMFAYCISDFDESSAPWTQQKRCNLTTRRIRISGLPSARHFIMLGMQRRGSRIQFISLPDYTMISHNIVVEPRQRFFHHYSNRLPPGHVVESFFTIDGLLFVSAIVDRQYISIFPIDVRPQDGTLKITVSDRSYKLPVELCPPAPHEGDFVKDRKSEEWYLVIRYSLSPRNEVKLRFSDVLQHTVFGSAGANENVSDYYQNLLVLHDSMTECKAIFGDFHVFTTFRGDSTDRRRIISKSLPSSREAFPFTVAFTDAREVGSKNISGYPVMIFSLLVALVGSFVLEYVVNRRERTRRRIMESKSSSNTRSQIDNHAAQ